MKKVVLSTLIIGVLLTIGTVIAILYAYGYRLAPQNGRKFIEGTGLLVATSKPDGARVLISDKLTTATNNTINLAPGEYDVKIEKDGYIGWKKKIIVKKGLVSEADALLLLSAPKLEAITAIGVANAILDQGGGILAYTVASSSASKNGIYVISMTTRPLIFLATSGSQIVNDTQDLFSSAQLSFSPDGKNLLAKVGQTYYLLDVSSNNSNPQDVTNILLQIQTEWEVLKAEQDKKLTESLPRALRPVASTYFRNPIPSPDGNRLIYTASMSAVLPKVLKKKVPSVNSTQEVRELKNGNLYVYDIKEDKNYIVFDAQVSAENEKAPQFFWYPDGRHLVFTEDNKVNIAEFDSENLTTVYDGPFLGNLVFPWPDGSGIGILAKLSTTLPPNLYRIGLQ